MIILTLEDSPWIWMVWSQDVYYNFLSYNCWWSTHVNNTLYYYCYTGNWCFQIRPGFTKFNRKHFISTNILRYIKVSLLAYSTLTNCIENQSLYPSIYPYFHISIYPLKLNGVGKSSSNVRNEIRNNVPVLIIGNSDIYHFYTNFQMFGRK